MLVIVRIVGLALFMALLGVFLTTLLFASVSDRNFAGLVLGCAGAVVGAIAGAAREIAARKA